MNWLKNYERIIAIEQLLVWQPVTELDPRAYVPEVSYTRCIFTHRPNFINHNLRSVGKIVNN